MYAEFAAVLVFLILGTAFVVGNLLLGWLVRPNRPTPEKRRVYECGEPTVGSAWIRYNSRFYTVALVYLLFDVEVVLLVPAALVMRELAASGMGWAPLAAVLVFLAALTLGLAYEWFYGNLDWIREKGGEETGALDDANALGAATNAD
jgi:NADH-quinone oxidoreductase subunit A